MRLIADSGSTKTDWVAVGEDGQSIQLSSVGLNPFFHNSESIADILTENAEMMQLADNISEVFFYGAGCSSVKNNLIVQKGLEQVFSNAHVVVKHDFYASAYATYDGRPGINCILGTGSNSCFFDGESLYEEVPALGHIMGDEGSGSFLGKNLLKAYLYKQLPENIRLEFDETYKTSKDEILINVLSKPGANIYLASFAKFYNSRMHEPFLRNIIVNGFKEFMGIHVTCFENYRDVPCHFVGSIAFYHKAELQEAADSLGVNIGNILKKPIHKLVEYHEKYVKKSA